MAKPIKEAPFLPFAAHTPFSDTPSRFLGRRLSPLHLLAFFSISPLLAQEIRSVETVCKIYPDGSAVILQSWDVTVTSGTEWYIPIGYLNGMEISDFHVYEGEEEREYLDEGRSWDSGRDLSQKAGRSGIVDKGPDGVELCWGLNWPWRLIRGGGQGELFRFLLRE